MNCKNDNSICLPDGWKIRYTSTGRPYFYNRALKKTTWKDPRMSEVDEMLHRSVTKLFAQKLVVKIDSISKTRYLHANVNGSPISILLDTGARSALISRSLTHPQNVFKVKKVLLKGAGGVSTTDKMVKILLTHEQTSSIEIFAYVVDKLLTTEIILGQIDIPKIMNFETLNNGNAYLDTIYGQVFYPDWKNICETSKEKTTFANNRKNTRFRVRTKSCSDIDSVRFLINSNLFYKPTNKLYFIKVKNNNLTF